MSTLSQGQGCGYDRGSLFTDNHITLHCAPKGAASLFFVDSTGSSVMTELFAELSPGFGKTNDQISGVVGLLC